MEEKLNKLITDVEVIKTRLENFIQYVNEDISDTSEDHEKRIRSLESFKSKFIGAMVLGNIVTGAIIAIIVAFIAK